MKRNEKAVAVMLVAIAVGVVAQRVARQEAVILGVTPLELGLISAAVSALVARKLA